MVKFNGSVFSLVFRHPVHPRPHHRPPPFSKKATATNSFKYMSTFGGVGGKPRQTSELLQQPGYKYLTLFFPEEK